VSGRIVLFGATGYTGRLTAEALVARGAKAVLAGRDRGRLEALAAELGGELETAVADVADPASVGALVESGDVLLTTVGPFARWGDAAASAAIDAKAWYLDSTGEPAFIRRVFEEFGPRAEAAGTGMLTAFGYDWVPGNLAAELALRSAGAEATSVDVGYYMTGNASGGMSGGTRASTAGAMAEPAFAWRNGRIRTERAAARVRSFPVNGRQQAGISVGSSEHFTLPRIHPGLREVNSYLGWFGAMSRPMQALSATTAAIAALPGGKNALRGLAGRMVRGSTGGPDADTRAKTGSHVVAIAYGPGREQLAEVHVAGGNGYDFTARVLAWGAVHAAEHGFAGTGALGPVEAFGLDALEAGCAEAGISRA
jgi:short subunit dehydrogenase-like uncharacterized protein